MFKDTPLLQRLSANNCSISHLDEDNFSLIGNLLHLSLKDNSVTKVQRRLFSGVFRNLKSLNMDGNQIGVIEDGAFKQMYLEYLGLSGNKMSYVFENPNTFQDLTVKQLSLGYNGLENVDKAILSPFARSLEYLDLSGNSLDLRGLRDTLSSLDNLKVLNLTVCGITDFPGMTIPYFLHLQRLILDRNHLSDIPVSLIREQFSKRRMALDLRWNKFTRLDPDLISELKGLPLTLRGNPWDCNCQLEPLHKWILTFPSTANCTESPDDVTCIRCHTPVNLEGALIRSLNESTIYVCPPPDKGASLSAGAKAAIAIVVILILIGILLLVLYILWRRRMITYDTKENKKANKVEDDKGFVNVTVNLEDELPPPPGSKKESVASTQQNADTSLEMQTTTDSKDSTQNQETKESPVNSNGSVL